MRAVPGLDEPLAATKGITAAEDAVVEAAIAGFRRPRSAPPAESVDLYAPLARFVDAHPQSGWSAAVLTNLGLAAYAMALVDRPVGERMHARLGHAAAMEVLFAEIGDRR